MNKKTFLIFSILSLVLVIAFIGPVINNSQNNNDLPKLVINRFPKTGSDGNITEVKLTTELPNVPEKIMVYKVKKPNLSMEKVRETARKLGIEGEIKENNIDLRVKSDKGEYIIDKVTGSENFMTKEFELQHEPLKTILSDEKYKNLAIEFLNKKGLMKDKAVFIDVNKDNTVTTIDKNGNEKTMPFMIEVRFGREDLNNLSFNGVGPKISVYFGDNGKIIGVGSVWREVEPYMEYPIVSPSKGIEQIKNNNAVVFNVTRNDVATVKNMKLMYISDPINYDQEFIIPHYIVTGTNTSGKSFTGLTKAISKEYIQEKAPVSKIKNVPTNHEKKRTKN